MSLIYNSGLCAKCNRNLKTNIQSRQKITLQWMRSLIKLLNDDDTNMNEYVCCKCYFELSKYKFNDGFEEFTESVKKEEKEVKEEILIESSNEILTQKLDFEQITERRCKALTGLTLANLKSLCAYIKNEPPVRLTKLTCVGFYMMRLRLDLSTSALGSLYIEPSEYQAKEIVKYVRIELFNNFTCLHLGTKNINRKDVIDKKSTTMAKILLSAEDDSIITIWDATYIYINKSSSFELQRVTYSGHKYRNLVKFMIVCTTGGYILEVIGPFICNGQNNDANITIDVLNKNTDDLDNFFRPDDVFVVDRGFRDAIDYLESKGYKYKMPSFLGKDKNQHTPLESNASRLVTKIRWVIESVNGRIKKWAYFANILDNMNIPFIEFDFKNICAIINLFRPNIANVNDEEKLFEYRKMVILATKENLFQQRVSSKYKPRILKNKLRYDPLKILFPVLTEEYIKHLTLGVYQLKQAVPYTLEHIDDQGNYLFELYEEEIDILHVKIKSRFSRVTTHNIWLGYQKDYKLTEGRNPITDWYCDCKAGARIFGMCAHITIQLHSKQEDVICF